MQLPIYLIGYMGAGKTSIGQQLAELLKWHFVDLDAAFEQIHGYTPAEYIREYGVEAFRRKEKYVLEDIADASPYEKVIYATGGGYPCWEDNMDCLHELGTSIYIRWQPKHLAKRLLLTDLSERPVLQGKTEAELLACIQPQLEAREPYYQKADIIIDAPLQAFSDLNDQELALHLCQLIKSKMK